MPTEADGTLVTATGRRVPPLPLDHALIIDRSIVIYGPSGSGKSTIVKGLMKILQPVIDQIIVVCPTEPSNKSYEGYVDAPYIHYNPWIPDPAKPKKDDGKKGVERFLKEIWNRQAMLADVHKRANKAEHLSSLFARLPAASRAEADAVVRRLKERRRRSLDDLRARYGRDAAKLAAAEKRINDNIKKMLMLVYKKFIEPHRDALCRDPDVSDEERHCLQYMNANPRLLLIFDDCAAQLKQMMKSEIMRQYFYQNRHSYITLVMCCQDDTDLDTNLRKNAFISFFTEPVVCRSNFERKSNQYSREVQDTAEDISGDLFTGHRKLAYIREDPRKQYFYHVTIAEPAPFLFGSAAVRELAAAVHNENASGDKENPYYDKFR